MRRIILALSALALAACTPAGSSDVNEAETTVPPPVPRAAPPAAGAPATPALQINRNGVPIQLTYSYSGLPGMHILTDKVTGCQFFAPVAEYDSYSERYTYKTMIERPNGRGGQAGCRGQRVQ
jgi:hypothetical protein